MHLHMDMYGASLFFYGGNYHSRGAGGVVYVSSMEFGNSNVCRYDGNDAENVREMLTTQDAVQKAIRRQPLKVGP